ncbi:RDD family protein [Paenibacillus validus]|uniref:RDD family protein n=2 Tax=Paenibacillus validus TaxID=44253 RepID=A0A7X2Z8E5_9BACL|nr:MULTISPECIES: RDD family protein [Paenibacillus]MED4602230.1 RDD family protein [Paenibacillus validus]MUG70218.1 RDD family protein [Paenibacillus validus]
MNDSYNREATVVTPEHVRLQFRTAGLGSRTAAQLIDVLLLMLVFGAVCLLIGLALMVMGIGVNDMPGEYALAFIIVFSSVLSGGYFVLAEYYMNGQTVGKKQLGLRVIQENGQPVTFLSAIIRNFFRLIDFLPWLYFLGGLWIFFHPMDKRLGDLAAGTLVVRDTRREQLHRRRQTEKWLNQREMAGRPNLSLTELQRRRVEREDWLLLSAYVERIPSLTRIKRDALAAEIAGRLAAKLELEAELRFVSAEAFLMELYVLLAGEWTL